MVQNGPKWSKWSKMVQMVENGQKWSKMVGLTLSGPDVPSWAPEGREGRSQEAQRASSLKPSSDDTIAKKLACKYITLIHWHKQTNKLPPKIYIQSVHIQISQIIQIFVSVVKGNFSLPTAGISPSILTCYRPQCPQCVLKKVSSNFSNYAIESLRQSAAGP